MMFEIFLWSDMLLIMTLIFAMVALDRFATIMFHLLPNPGGACDVHIMCLC